MRIPWQVAVAALIGVGVLAMPSPALTATPTPNPSPTRVEKPVTFRVEGTGTIPPPTPALRVDAEVTAQALDADVDLVLDYLVVTPQWNDALDSIAAAFPDLVTSGYRNGPKDPTGRLVLTAPPPPEALATLEDLPFDVVVQTDGPASETRLAEAASAAAAAVRDSGLTSPMITGVDPRTNVIEVVVRPETPPADVATLQSRAQVASDRVVGSERAVDVEVRIGTDGEIPVTYAFTGGGQSMNSPSGNDPCTSGFTTSRGGVNGVTTAKHCFDGLRWAGNTGIIAFDREATNASNGEIDLQFHKSIGGNVASPRFWATGTAASDIRTVLRRSNAAVGDQVCKFGRRTGYRCPFTVLRRNVGSWRYDGTYVGLTEIRSNSGDFDRGDSGGPIFMGNTAHGSTSGGAADGSRAHYVPQTRWSENLGATIVVDN